MADYKPLKQMTCFDWTYDVISILIGLADVITDYMITYQYYSQGHMGFFWVALILLCIMHIFCGGVIVLLLDLDNPVSKVAVFICVLPFASLFPGMIWLQSVELWDIICPCGSNIINETPFFDDDHDYTAEWLKMKV